MLLPEMRSADPWSKVYRLNGGESCFAVAENYVYLSREGDVVFPLTDDSTLVAEFPVYVYRYGEQDGASPTAFASTTHGLSTSRRV